MLSVFLTAFFLETVPRVFPKFSPSQPLLSFSRGRVVGENFGERAFGAKCYVILAGFFPMVRSPKFPMHSSPLSTPVF